MDRDRNDRGPGLERPWTGKMVNLTPDWTVFVHNLSFLCLGKAVLCDYGLSWVSSHIFWENSVDLNQMPRNAESDQGLTLLAITLISLQ